MRRPDGSRGGATRKGFKARKREDHALVLIERLKAISRTWRSP